MRVKFVFFGYGIFVGPKAVKKPFVDEEKNLNATSVLVQWNDLPNKDVHGNRRDWTLAYIPERDIFDDIIPTPSRRRKRRDINFPMDEDLQTDWYEFLFCKAYIRCNSETMLYFLFSIYIFYGC